MTAPHKELRWRVTPGKGAVFSGQTADIGEGATDMGELRPDYSTYVLIRQTVTGELLLDVDFHSERLKHALDDVRKFAGRRLCRPA